MDVVPELVKGICRLIEDVPDVETKSRLLEIIRAVFGPAEQKVGLLLFFYDRPITYSRTIDGTIVV